VKKELDRNEEKKALPSSLRPSRAVEARTSTTSLSTPTPQALSGERKKDALDKVSLVSLQNETADFDSDEEDEILSPYNGMH
jgi:hypothetical protein